MKLPRYEYDLSLLRKTIDKLKGLEAPFGLTVRYAVKANPHAEIIKLLDASGIHFDASSSFEASELLEQGIAGNRVSLSSQQAAHNLQELIDTGVIYTATSLNQIKHFLQLENRPKNLSVRINSGFGAGGNNRTSTGGVTSSFGIWHEYIPDVLELVSSRGVKIDRVHIHVGSGADPSIWGEVIDSTLQVIEKFPDATSLDIGGGFKVKRWEGEKEADMPAIFEVFSQKLSEFYEKTGRKIKLEIEPGTYMVAHIGILVAYVDDIVDTGKSGYKFIRLDTGMNDFMRPTLYGSQHKIEVVNESEEYDEYVVVGHNCESGDVLTTEPGNPELIKPGRLKKAAIGDEVRIYDVGAYSAAMRAKGYNSFPDADEVIINS